MPVSTNEAIRVLDTMIEMARDDEDLVLTKHYGKIHVTVMLSEDNHVAYFLGINEVDRRVALYAVRTFEEASR